MIINLIKKHKVLFGFFVLFTINFIFAYMLFLLMFSYIYYKFSNKSLKHTIQFIASIIYVLSYFVVLFFYSDMFYLNAFLVLLYLIYFVYINSLLTELFIRLNKIQKRYSYHESNFITQKYILFNLDELIIKDSNNHNRGAGDSDVILDKIVYYSVFSVVNNISVFRERLYKNMLLEAIRHWQSNRGLIVYNWCLLDDSLHLIVSSRENNLKNILDDLKTYISQRVLLSIESNENEVFKEWIINALSKEDTNKQLWKNESVLGEISLRNIANQKINYIHNIPVELGIVGNPEDYIYSSAKDYGIRQGLLDLESIK